MTHIAVSRDKKLMMADGIRYVVATTSRYPCSNCAVMGMRQAALIARGDHDDHDNICDSLCGEACPRETLGAKAAWKRADAM